ncbi:MAG: hypothetical protein ILO68_01130 [Clostridia bacterium]|nr:hypothetical protein [Clostridia bacterium]
MRPTSAPADARRGNTTKRLLIWAAVLFVVLFAAELIVSNFTALSVLGLDESVLSLEDAVLSGKTIDYGDSVYLNPSGTLRFPSVGTPVRSVSIRMSSDTLDAGTVVASLLDEAAAESYHVYATVRYYTQGVTYIRIRSSGDCKELRLNLEGNGSSRLEEIRLNDAPPFSFSPFRFLFLFLLAFLLVLTAEKRWWRSFVSWRNDPENGAFPGSAHVAPTLILLLLTLVFVVGTVQNIGFTRIPLPANVRHDAYTQLFSSLLQGRLDLDVSVDPSRLEGLTNPYDVTERTAELSGIGAIWDRAYYDGHFYCYFGIAPIFAVYYPVYALSFGTLIPKPGTASLFLLIAALLGIYSALQAMAATFRIRKPALLFWISIPACALGFLLPTLGSSSDMYYLPISSAYAFFSWTLAFGFGAFQKKKAWKRRLLLVLSGFCLAMTVASRPNIALYGAMLFPLFISWILKEKKTWWKEAVCFALPLLAGVGLVFWYNAARFGSPFEFGASYQMTVHDIRSCGIRFSLLGESFVHYFLQSPSFSGLFPYFGPSKLDLASYGVYFYSARNIGAYHIPVTVLPLGCLFRGNGEKKDRVRDATYLIALLLPFAIAFIDLCLAGTCIRYLFDILFPLALVGILLLWEWGEAVAERASDRTGFRLMLLLAAPLVLTCAAGFALTFSNERSWILSGSTYLFRFIEQFFVLR